MVYDYTIREIDLDDSAQRAGLNRLLSRTFGFEMGDRRIIHNTRTTSRFGSSLYVGAFYGEEIIGCNAFISMDFRQGNRWLSVYQTCWSSTSPDHRKKRIYSRTKEAGKEILESRGAAGLIAFPNAQSNAIAVRHLGYVDLGLFSHSFFPTWLPASVVGQPIDAPWPNPVTIQPDQDQLLALKRQEHGQRIQVFQDSTGNRIWGKFETLQKGPVQLRVFKVGGLDMFDKAAWPAFLPTAAKSLGIRWWSFVYHPSSDYRHLFRFGKTVPSGNLLYCPLNEPVETFGKVNFLAGVMDTF